MSLGLSLVISGFAPWSAIPAFAEERPLPPKAASDDPSRQREAARQQFSEAEQRHTAELERDERLSRASDTAREAQRQAERNSRDQARATASALANKKAARPIVPATVPAPVVDLQTCSATVPSEVLVASGSALSLIGSGWTSKNRGMTQAFIRAASVEASVGGVAIPNPNRFFIEPIAEDSPTLGRVWSTNWVYPLSAPIAPVIVRLRVSLDHPIVDLLTFDEAGKPVHRASGLMADLTCTLRPALTVTGRITGAGAGLADGEVIASDAVTGAIPARTQTNANGDFSLPVGPGTYRFYFRSLSGPWVPEYWNDKASSTDATLVTLAFGSAPPRMDADLERGVIVAGRVTDGSTTLGVENVNVIAQPFCCEAFFASTDRDGAYRMAVRKGIALKVAFFPPSGAIPYVTQYWNGRPSFEEADLLPIGTTGIAGVNAVLERGVFVRGRITDATTGLPLRGSVSASAINVTCCQNFSAAADDQGNYAMPVRKNTTITVGFFPPLSAIAYVPSYWNGKRSFSDADPVAVGTTDVPNINGALERGVWFRGRVTDALTLQPVPQTTITAQSAVCCEVTFGFTAADGTYSAAVRTMSNFKVGFFPPKGGAIPYVSEWYSNRATFSDADVVPVGLADLTGIDAALDRGVFVRGHVSDAENGAPVPQTSVSATPSSGLCCENFFGFTDTHGDYAMAIRQNVTVKVSFSPQAGTVPYLPQWYSGKSSFDTANVVIIGSVNVDHIDAALGRGAFLAGRVTDAQTGLGLSGISVNMQLTDGACCGFFASTDSNGGYRTIVPRNVSLKVGFFPPFGGSAPYLSQWYRAHANFFDADVVNVGTTDVVGIDAALELGVFVRGRVTDAATGAALQFASVSAERVDAACCEFFSASTDASGDYAMTVRKGIRVRVTFYPPFNSSTPYLNQWWDHKASYSAADELAIGSADVANINGALPRGVPITGRVTDATGTGVALASVNAFVEGPCCESFYASTDSSGYYTLAVRENVSVRIGFSPPYGSDLLPEFYDDKPDFDRATIVPVGTAPLANINAVLAQGVRVTGRVTDAAGTGIANVNVNASVSDPPCCVTYYAQTAPDGSYSMTVPAGNFKFAFWPQPSSGFLSEYYNNKPHFGVADVVPIGPGPATIDAVLALGVTVSGRVTDASTTAGLGGVQVDLFAMDGSGNWFGFTDVLGFYSATVPQNTTIKVAFTALTAVPYARQWYDGKANEIDATPITVGTIAVTGINAAMVPPSDTIAPTMVDARITGEGLPSTDFVEPGDAFSVTFSEGMNAAGNAIFLVQDQDGSTAAVQCSTAPGPNRATCGWDVTFTFVKVTLSGALSWGGGTTPGFSIPFNIVGVIGAADLSGNPVNVLGSPDRYVDFEVDATGP